MSYSSKLFLKVILAGEAGVGKTSLRRTYLGVNFQEDHLATIGADFSSYSRDIGGKPVLFQIWDVAGQDTFQSMRRLYYKGALGALIVFDLTELSTFEAIKKWIKELEDGSGRGIVPFLILGNKLDLITKSQFQQIKKKVQKFVNELNSRYSKSGFSVEFFATSAKTGENVHQAFEILGEKILNYLEERRKRRE